MADQTHIEWTDATWNIVTGCDVVSPGCTNCYAMRLAGTRLKHHPSRAGLTKPSRSGPVWTGEVRFNRDWLDQPLRWKKPRRIFVAAHGDLFHENVPDDVLDQVFAVMALSPQHQFQVLTKRPERMREYLDADPSDRINAHAGTLKHWDDIEEMAWPLPNVWLGVSVEDQQRADERIPPLLATPAAVRFVSAEPLLGPVDLTRFVHPQRIGVTGPHGFERHDIPPLHWVIVGGESQAGARPMHPDWARGLRDQCAGAGVPFFFKQWGKWFPFLDRDRDDPDWRADYAGMARHPERYRTLNLEGGCGFHGERVHIMERIGKKAAGRDLDGRTHDEVP